MPTKRRRKDAEPKTAERAAASPRDENWDERLRLVGDARFVEVEWSGRDNPVWPLPRQ